MQLSQIIPNWYDFFFCGTKKECLEIKVPKGSFQSRATKNKKERKKKELI